jgi:hypothetical protein
MAAQVKRPSLNTLQERNPKPRSLPVSRMTFVRFTYWIFKFQDESTGLQNGLTRKIRQAPGALRLDFDSNFGSLNLRLTMNLDEILKV